jgi:16S rRNA (guanine966-N2)-methyltransferase
VVLKLATGKFKGITLASSDTAKELRPTQAVIREAIINTLFSLFIAEEFDLGFGDLDILDLYSGTGSMGYEFMSNGAEAVNFVDYDPKCIKLLETNAKKLKIADKVKITRGKLPQVLKKIKESRSNRAFNTLFCDPPFKFTVEEFIRTINGVFEQDLLEKGSLIVLEYKNLDLAELLQKHYSAQLEILKSKQYGDCSLVIARSL